MGRQPGRKGVSALMALKPETATRLRNGEREEVAINTLRPGDVIEVAAGGRLPADGKLVSGFASFDESALTGESIPVERATGESPGRCYQRGPSGYAGSALEPGASAIDRILKLIEEAEERRAPLSALLTVSVEFTLQPLWRLRCWSPSYRRCCLPHPGRSGFIKD